MRTKTLQQTVTLKASPRQIYDMLMDSKKHQSLSGERAKISKKVGGKFTAWGSHISGINLVLKPGSKIVQAWRATGWWPDHYSIAIYDIKRCAADRSLNSRRSEFHPIATAVTIADGSRPTGRPCKKYSPPAGPAKRPKPGSRSTRSSGSAPERFGDDCRRRHRSTAPSGADA